MKWVILDAKVIWMSECGRIDIDVYIPFPTDKSDLVVRYIMPWSDTINRKEEGIVGDVMYDSEAFKRKHIYPLANYMYECSMGKKQEIGWKEFLKKVLIMDRLSWEMEKWHYHHKLKTYRNIFGDKWERK